MIEKNDYTSIDEDVKKVETYLAGQQEMAQPPWKTTGNFLKT